MRTSYSIPLVGAAVLTAGAVAVGIFRFRCRPTALAAGPQSASPRSLDPIGRSTPPSVEDQESLLERLRQSGF